MARGIKAFQTGQSLAMKNKIINGCFRLWQRNTTFSANGYTADRWYANIGTGGSPAMTLSRQSFTLGQTDVPNEPQYYLRFNQTALASSTAPYLEQRIEYVRTLAGQSASISFYAKADSSRTISADAIQNFGTSGSPSGDVTTNIGSFNLTTSWQRFTQRVSVPSISGKTLGSDNNDKLILRFSLPLNATFTIEFSSVQIEAGGASSFELRDIGVETRLCQRYYEKTYNQSVVPGTATVLGLIGVANYISSADMGGMVRFLIPKRANAAMSYWDGNGNASKASQYTGGTWYHNYTCTVSGASETSFLVYNGAVVNTNMIHYTADAEL